MPGDLIGYHAARRKAEAGLNFAKKQIEEHRRTLDKENPRDFIDTFLVEMKKNSDTFTGKIVATSSCIASWEYGREKRNRKLTCRPNSQL